MKKLNYLLLFMMFACFSYSQQDISDLFSDGSKQSTVKDTTLVVDGMEFIVKLSKNRLLYIPRKSKRTGKPYRQYVGRPTDKTYKGKPVYTNSNGNKYYILLVKRQRLVVRRLKRR